MQDLKIGIIHDLIMSNIGKFTIRGLKKEPLAGIQ